MKQILLLTITFGIITNLVAQSNTYPWPSNAPIGIGTTNPQGPLHILNNNNTQSILLESSSAGWGSGMVFKNTASTGRTYGIYAGAWGSFQISDNILGVNRLIIASNGYVGVGTNSPMEKMDVSGFIQINTGSSDGGRLVWRGGTNGTQEYRARVAPDGHLGFFPGEGNTTALALTQSGNVGIGTNTPEMLLDIRRDQNDVTRSMVRNMGAGANVSARYDLSTATANSYVVSSLNDNNGNPYYLLGCGPAVHAAFFDAKEFNWRNTSGSTLMKIGNNGNVGIGSIGINDLNYKLYVETGIRTRRVKVDQSTWADYVFADNYRLPSLQEVEEYIKRHKHLPEVPTAEEVKKEGVDIGDTQVLLLKKIEELTLYLIGQNKKLEEQRIKIELLQKQVNEINKKN